MTEYTGSTSLNHALSKLNGKTKDFGNSAFADITRPYKQELGLGESEPITKPEHKLHIYNKEVERISKQQEKPDITKTKAGKEVKAIVKKDGSIVPARGKSAIKRKRVSEEFKRAITVEKGRVVDIYLEPAFVTLAEVLAKKTNSSDKAFFIAAIKDNDAKDDDAKLNHTAAVRVWLAKEAERLLNDKVQL